MKIIYQGKTKTGKDIIIRYPETSDLEEMLRFINTISDEKTFITFQGEHETLESERKYLKKCLEDIKNKKATHLKVFCEDELVGAGAIEMKEKVEKHVGSFGLIVSKDYRNQGVGKLLMKLVEEEAIKMLQGLKIITLEVYSVNNVARSLYKKMGFVEYGILPNGISRDEGFEDSVLMYKNI